MRKRNGARRKAVLGVILSTAMVLLGLAGCGVIGEKYVYVEWYTRYFETYYQRWFDEFEREHADENVRIKYRSMAMSTAEKVYTMLISNTLSDCISIDSGTAVLLLENDCLEAVPEEMIERGDFPGVALSLATTKDGKLVAFPGGVGMRPFLYFNREVLKEAATSVEEVPETFGEFRKWAPKLFKWEANGEAFLGPLDEEKYPKAKMVRRPLAMIRGFVWSAIPILISYVDPLPDADGKTDNSLDDYLGGPPSGRPFRFDTPEFIKGLEIYRDFYLPTRTAVVDGGTSRVRAFQEGIYAGVEAANWIYGEVFTIDMQVARMPHAPGRPARLYTNSSSVGVSRNSKHKRLAFEFAKFVTSTEAQVDAYYGHGYTPARFSSWERLIADGEVDEEIRARFLKGGANSGGGYVGVPRIKRRNHEQVELYLHVLHEKDVSISTTSCCGATADGAEVEVVEAIPSLAGGHRELAARLAREVAGYTGLDVTVIVQGTPEDMIRSRSYVTSNPAEVYAGLLESGFYCPVDKTWDRLLSEVVRRVCQFVTRTEEPLTPAEGAAWAQQEAEDILAGRK